MTTVNKTLGENLAHKQTVKQITGKSNPQSADGVLSSTWPDGTPKSMNNAFAVRPLSLFANDQTERAKATLHRNQSIYGQATGAKVHGAAVIEGLSDRAQKQLKAVPFSAPVSSGRKTCTPTLKHGGSSVCTQAHLSGGDK